jgi:methylthioribose-1-phosphate isomerase
LWSTAAWNTTKFGPGSDLQFQAFLRLSLWTTPKSSNPRTQTLYLKPGVPHTLVADNTGGHLMQHGLVDLVITGADRVLYTGDVCNKIGTYLKALAAKDNDVPM